ncbi:CLUMA_CG006122, isoform A [Clunio marinus]|uniref:CLUMA_CG006122, isoform A n=1 Tax=Clunio marinus TaxID=568069 RepID=A0A1J1I2F9_9DIPT|nr:CLUMA_CG006122, isoform A [Clunio marinus]
MSSSQIKLTETCFFPYVTQFEFFCDNSFSSLTHSHADDSIVRKNKARTVDVKKIQQYNVVIRLRRRTKQKKEKFWEVSCHLIEISYVLKRCNNDLGNTTIREFFIKKLAPADVVEIKKSIKNYLTHLVLLFRQISTTEGLKASYYNI